MEYSGETPIIMGDRLEKTGELKWDTAWVCTADSAQSTSMVGTKLPLFLAGIGLRWGPFDCKFAIINFKGEGY